MELRNLAPMKKQAQQTKATPGTKSQDPNEKSKWLKLTIKEMVKQQTGALGNIQDSKMTHNGTRNSNSTLYTEQKSNTKQEIVRICQDTNTANILNIE